MHIMHGTIILTNCISQSYVKIHQHPTEYRCKFLHYAQYREIMKDICVVFGIYAHMK